MNLLAQNEVTNGLPRLLESAPTDEIMVMFVVFTVFTTLLLVTVAICVTHTVRTIKVASINARLTEKLASQGIPMEQVEQLVRANQRRPILPRLSMPSRWRKAQTRGVTMPGKPAPLRA